MCNNQVSAGDAGLREVSPDELNRIDGGKTYVDINLFGYSLAIGDEGIMVCKPGACVVVAWDALK